MHSVVRAGQAAEWGVGVYVRIHGKISDFDNKNRVQAFQIKPVTDFNEARASVPAAHAGGPAPACQRAPVCACLRGQGPCGSEAVFGAQARQRPPACRGAVAGGCEDGACRAPAADRTRAGSRRALSPRLRAGDVPPAEVHLPARAPDQGRRGGRRRRRGAPRSMRGCPARSAPALHVPCMLGGVRCRRSPPAWSFQRACGSRRSPYCGTLHARSNSSSPAVGLHIGLRPCGIERGTYNVPGAAARCTS